MPTVATDSSLTSSWPVIRAAFVAIFLILPLSSEAAGQTSRRDPTDLQGWYGAALVLDLPDGWEGSIQYRLRTVENASDYRGSYLTWEAKHRHLDWLEFQWSYRLARVEDGTFHRVGIGSELRHDVGQIRLSARSILQYQKQTFADDDADANLLLRTRLRARYSLEGGHNLYASVEPYFSFGADYPIDNWRNTIGFQYEIAPGFGADLFYIYRPDYAREYNRTFHIVGLDLEFTREVDW